VRLKLDQHVYVSVLPFATDLANVFRDAMEFDPDGNSTKLTSEQKEIKMRANRIIGKIRPILQEAARKEAELGMKVDVEEDVQTVEILFQNCFRADLAAVQLPVAEQDEPEEEMEGAMDATPDLTSGRAEERTRRSPRKSPTEPSDVKHNGDIEMADTPEPPAQIAKRRSPRAGESTATNAAQASNDVTDTAVIRLQIAPGQTIPISNIDGSLPALSNSGSTNPSTTHADPLTPPRSEKDILAPLAQGGIPWYLRAFSPEGTTVYDEQWQGRDVLRGMTEELSEIDDDALNGLIDKDMPDVAPVSHQSLEVASAHKQRARPKRKRPR
jgi:NuA3 HAT complex component NTO1